jgi:hypothetical protein
MLPLLIAIAALFALLLIARVGGARRRQVMRRWPALVLGLIALVLVARAQLLPALAFAALATLALIIDPRDLFRAAQPPSPPPSREDPKDVEARQLLGLAPHASEEEIRAAYRDKMKNAHPDQGGSHNEAARLAAARDRLLRRK